MNGFRDDVDRWVVRCESCSWCGAATAAAAVAAFRIFMMGERAALAERSGCAIRPFLISEGGRDLPGRDLWNEAGEKGPPKGEKEGDSGEGRERLGLRSNRNNVLTSEIEVLSIYKKLYASSIACN